MNQAPTSLYKYIDIPQVGLMNQAPTIWKKVASPLFLRSMDNLITEKEILSLNIESEFFNFFIQGRTAYL